MGRSFASAGEVVAAIAATQWKLFDSMRQLGDDRSDAARAVLQRVAEAMRSDQHVVDLRSSLRTEQTKAIDLLTPAASPRQMKEVGDAGTEGATRPLVSALTKSGKKVIESDTLRDVSLDAAEAEIARLRDIAKGPRV